MPRQLSELQGSSESVTCNTCDSRDIASPILRLVKVVGLVGDERRAVLLIGAPPSRSIRIRAIVDIVLRVEPGVDVASALRVTEPVVAIVVRVVLGAVVVSPRVPMVVVSALYSVKTVAMNAVMAMMAVVLWKSTLNGAAVAAQSTMEARITTIAAMVTTVAATVAIVVPMATVGSISTVGC